MSPSETVRIKGGNETQFVIGVGIFTVLNGLRGYAITVRSQGTIIAAINVQDEGGPIRAYTPTWLGVALNQGDYMVAFSPIVSIQLTAAADSIAIHCDKPY